jgi:5-dehydro-4-deoxyglucarate dehydratase
MRRDATRMTSLTGVLAFLPTPFTADGELDDTAVERQIDFLIRGGASSVVVAGGVGEFYALNADEHQRLVAGAVSAAAGRVPVIAGVGHSTAIATELAQQAVRRGAAALMVNPLYFVRPELRGVVEHYRRIGAAADTGLIIFSTADVMYGPDELEALAAVPEAIAVKDEYGDVAMFTRNRERMGERYTWINGMAEPLAWQYAAAGAEAMTSGLVNVEPALSIGIWAAAEAADRDRYDALMLRAEPILALRRSRPGYHTTVLKEAMAILGRATSRVRLPLVPLYDEERVKLRSMLASVNAVAAD